MMRENDPFNFLDFCGGVAIAIAVALVTTVAIGHIVGGDHSATEIYPVCKHGRISIRAVNSDGFSDDRTLQVFVDGARIARVRIDADQWERFATAMREPYAGCK